MAEVAPVVEDARANLLRRWWAASGLALFAATWKLWTPQIEFPQVPLFAWAGALPPFVDRLALGALLGSLAAAAWKPHTRRSWVAFAGSLGVLMVLDQHRLQPWAWQLLLMATVFMDSSASGGCQPSESLPVRQRILGGLTSSACLIQVLTISIYFWSAVSKLDAGFLASHGQTLVEALLNAVGIDAAPWSPRWKRWLAFCLPLGELLVAVGLCWPRTRRIALIAATALHVGLILALGPLGLGHQAGVLTWNVAFIGHIWLLFGARTFVVPSLGGSLSEARNRLKAELRTALIVFACLWPITERRGLCDRWLAWSVYVARAERVRVTLTDNGLQRLPESARRCATDGELPLDQWSLVSLNVPIYPQLRFQLGVVEWLRQRCGEDNLVEVIVQHSDGVRVEIERLTVEQFDEQRRAFWINTKPRPAKSP